MNKYFFCTSAILIFLGSISCNDPKTNKVSIKTNEIIHVEKKGTDKIIPTTDKTEELNTFLPKGYVVSEKIYGDLNKDGLDDCIIIIKATDKKKIIKDENGGELDRNRRGIIVLLNKNNVYELSVKNYDCFSSENEDGGAYYAPELSVEIEKANLILHYSHGTNGYWRYTFRFQNSDFKLIGYNASSNSGPIINTETSVNFLTKNRIVKENTNENAEGDDEVFKQITTKIKRIKLIKLSEIKDFDEFEVSEEWQDGIKVTVANN